MDFDARTITLNKNRKYFVTFTESIATEAPKLISAEKLDQLCSRGAVGFAMSVQFMTTVSNYTCSSIQPEQI